MSKFFIAGSADCTNGSMHLKLFQADSKLNVCRALLQRKAELLWYGNKSDYVIHTFCKPDAAPYYLTPQYHDVPVSRNLTEAAEQLLEAIQEDIGNSGGDNGVSFKEYKPLKLPSATPQPHTAGGTDAVSGISAESVAVDSTLSDRSNTPAAKAHHSKLFVLGSVDGTRGGSQHMMKYFQADSKLDICKELVLGHIELPWYGSKADKLIHRYQHPDLEVDEDIDVGFEVSRNLFKASKQLLDAITHDIDNSSSYDAHIFDEFELQVLPPSTTRPP